ncbi:MAG: hypothetical protein E6Q71_05820 [Pseudomonas sp.]|nr:MAG: hypothetical protein E6Q71_05820 [Pseudomonas sp.]
MLRRSSCHGLGGPFWTDELPDDLKAQLTPEELADWQTFVNDRNHQQERALWRFCLNNSVRMLAYASKALQAGEKPASPTLARKAAKLFMQSMDEAGFGEGKVGPGRPRKDAEMDADFLLLRTPEEFEQWERLKDQGEISELPNFIPPEAQKSEAPKKKGFPDYPEGDLIARALRLAFVGGEGESEES